MTTREEALAFGLSFADTYRQAPFHDDNNWRLDLHSLKSMDSARDVRHISKNVTDR